MATLYPVIRKATPTMLRRLQWLVAVTVAIALITVCLGCDGSVSVVKGEVLLDGEPLAGATVNFVPDGSGQPAIATTDEQGHFKLVTQAKGGVAAGNYRVVLTKVTGGTAMGRPPWIGRGAPTQSERDEWQRKLAEVKAQEREWVPERYRSTVSTPLKITVPADEKLRFELTSTPMTTR